MVVIAVILALIVLAVLLNGFAAGIVAFLHFGRGRLAGRHRVLLASLASGLVFLALIMLILIANSKLDEEPAELVAVMAIIVAVTSGVSLPGALLMSRRMKRGLDYGDTFA